MFKPINLALAICIALAVSACGGHDVAPTETPPNAPLPTTNLEATISAQSTQIAQLSSNNQATSAVSSSRTVSATPTQLTLVTTPTPVATVAIVASAIGMASKRHFEKDWGFSFIPPAGWQVLARSPTFIYFAVDGIDNTQINISFQRLNPGGGSLGEVVSRNIGHLVGNPDYTLVGRETFTTEDGTAGIKVSFHVNHVKGDRPAQLIVYFFDALPQRIVAAYTRFANIPQTHDPLVDQSMKTARFDLSGSGDLSSHEQSSRVTLSLGEKASFRLPDEGVRNNNGYIGPFCCTGVTAIVKNKSNEPIGYVYFYGWEGQAYIVGANRSIAPSIEIWVSGLADLSNILSRQEISKIYFAASEMSPGQSRSTIAGGLLYTATIEIANLELFNDSTYFDMGSVAVRMDVSIIQSVPKNQLLDWAELATQSEYFTVYPGDKIRPYIIVRNAGTTTWLKGKFGYLGKGEWSARWGTGKLWRDVKPGETLEFVDKQIIEAPSQPGSYQYGVQLTNDLGQPFGPYFFIQVNVVPKPQGANVGELKLLAKLPVDPFWYKVKQQLSLEGYVDFLVPHAGELLTKLYDILDLIRKGVDILNQPERIEIAFYEDERTRNCFYQITQFRGERVLKQDELTLVPCSVVPKQA
ncbi:MAG: hypothetical protein NZ823_10655 [Blastocatellia bacterium]|nr:hypothetical protein [Blastocatellia bacterium]